MNPRRGPFRFWRVRPRERLGEFLAIAGMVSLLLLFMTRPEWEDPGWQIAWAAASAGATAIGVFLLLTERGGRKR
jgi:peptidoglycan/LPS O-acetylase OafA/YrhL